MNEVDALLLLLAAIVWLGVCFGIFWLLGGYGRVVRQNDETELMEWAGAAMWLFWAGVGFLLGGVQGLEVFVVVMIAISVLGAVGLTAFRAFKGQRVTARHLAGNIRRMLFEVPVRFLDGL